MIKSTYWIKLRPMNSSENSSKGSKIDHRFYLMQEAKAKRFFFKLNNQLGPNQDFF